ncbi:MAG: PKD domain-containing protein [Bacteroidia bacterium]
MLKHTPKHLILLFISLFSAPLLKAQMSGTYSIDKTSSATRNYTSFTAAVNALNSVGVSGAVKFEVANGNYNEQITLLYVSGSSTTNTITFVGKDSSKVSLNYNCSQYEAVIKVNAAANFVFEGMTIKSTNASYGYGVHITSSAENISIRNCRVEVSATSNVPVECVPVNVAGGTVTTNGDNGEKIEVTNSVLRGGYYGLNIRGTNNSLLSEGFTIENNHFYQQRFYPVFAVFAKDLNLNENVIDSTNLFYSYSVYTDQCAGGSIIGNRIYAGRFGLYLRLHNYYNRADSLVISNNEISDFDDPSYQSGIYAVASYNISAYHNTIRTDGTVSNFNYSCIYLSNPYNHRILNNNLVAEGNSSVLFLGNGSLGSTYIDYNNYSTTANGGFVSWQGTSYSNLADLKAATSSQNQNSISENPQFSSKRNLSPNTPGLNNRARNGLSSFDILRNVRPKFPDVVSDIGAYEYYVDSNDIDIIAITSPLIGQLGNNDLAIVLKNNGSKPYRDSVFVQYKINNGSWTKDTSVYTSLAIGAADTFYFTTNWNITSSGTFTVCADISPVVPGDPDSLVGEEYCETKCVGRSGTFTIDASGNGDYTTFTQAINSLTCGIAGPITFKVKPGNYNERLTITPVLGASVQNLITFEGAHKDSVTLNYNGTSSLPASVLIDDADFLTFKNLTINNQGNQVSCGFWLREDVKNVRIENCQIFLDSVASIYSSAGILIANSLPTWSWTIPGNTSNNLVIKNNLIVGGSSGIRINGSGATATAQKLEIENNIIRKYYYQGLNAAYVSESKFKKNHITGPRLISAIGFGMFNCQNDSVDANYIQGGRFGLYLSRENFDNRNTFTAITNNMITNLIDANYQIGLMASLGYNLSIYHNSIWTSHSFSSPYYSGMNLYYCQNSFAKNNAIKATNGGMVFSKYYGNISRSNIDNNNYYGEGAAKYYHDGLTFTDLGTYKSIRTNFNSNSLEGEPNYTSITDLHASGAQLNNKGVNGLGVDKDYDDEDRPFSPDKKRDIGADEYYVSPFDLDLVSLDSPLVPVIGQNEVKIILRNAGIKDLVDDTMVVSYLVDGNLEIRDTVIISSLKQNESFTYTFSKTWNISIGKTYKLCAQLDTFFKPDPDSLINQQKCASMCPGAKGSYTIDASGGGDYTSFKAALNALNCGINGPVTFNVKNGTYNERLVINEIIGASNQNTVSFIGESRKGVILNYTGVRDSQEVIHLEGADYISFDRMTIKNNSQWYSRGVRISTKADYNTFSNVSFDLPSNATSWSTSNVYISDENLSTLGDAGNFNVFTNCSFEYGYFGVRLYGIGNTSLNYGNEFNNCSFRNHRAFGIYALYQGQLKVNDCSFDSLQLDFYQIYENRCSESIITNNLIKDGRYGIYQIYENYYFQEETSEISNNLISGQDFSTDIYGVDLYLCYNIKFFHNSLMVNKGTSGAAVRFRFGNGHDIRNNSFSKSTNAELFSNTNSSFSEIDFNNYYSGSSSNFVNYNGTAYDDLQKWSNAVSGFNRNSKEGDPGYNSSSDLTIDPKSKQLANWGSISTGIGSDFEGDIRNPQSPDVGADEFSDLYDIGVSSILSPLSNCELSNSETITIEIENKGNIALPSGELIPVAYSIDGSSAQVDTFILSSNLSKNGKVQFTFSQKADFSAFKSFNLKAYTDIANDSLRTNDTLAVVRSSFENPTADFSIDNIACSNEDVNFSNSSSTSVATISAYNWNFGNGLASTAQNSKTSYSNDGNFSIKLIVTTTNGCKDSITKSITVYPKPSASFTSSNLCFGDSAIFTNTSNIATSIGATFNWDFDDNTTSTKRSPKHMFATADDFDIEFIAISANGCKDTATSTIQISPNPVASFSFANSCKGDSNIFNNTSTIPNGFTPTYSWKFGDGNSSSNKNPKYVYGSIGNYTIELTASLANGCSNSVANSLNVFSKPQPAFTVSNGCQGDSILFTDNSVIQLDTIKNYEWFFDDGNISSLENPKNLYTNDGSYSPKLVLTSINGCKDSLTKNLTINEKPNASFSVNAVCENDTSKFYNSSSVSNGSIIQYNWTFGNGLSSSLASPKHVYSSYGSYNSTLIITSNNGCKDTANAIAQVNASPIANFDAPNVCFGSNLFIRNQSTIASGNITSYSWNLGDGTSSSTVNPVHRYTSKDTFTIKHVIQSNLGCKDSIEKDVIVTSKVIASFSTDSLCHGDSTAFKNTTNISCGTVLGYSWDFGDGNTSNDWSPKHKYANAGSYVVKLIVIQFGNVKDSTSQTVVINSIPKANFSFNNVCATDSASFINTSSIATGTINSYEWKFGDGNRSTALSPKHAYNSENTYSVTLTAVGSGGCIDSASKNVTAFELPVADFSLSNACLGSSVSFNNSSSITTGTLTFNWQFGNGFSSSQKNPNYNYSNNGTYTVKLTTTSNNGCVAADSQNVTIHPKPVANFTALNQCSNKAISFTNTSTISAGTVSYQWKFGDGNRSTAINPSHKYSSAGSYSVTLIVTSNNGCIDSVTKSISALPTPIANFTSPSSCSGTNLTFTNASSISIGTLTHSWQFGDGNVSTSISPTHNYSSTGTYQVKLVTTASSGCKDSITKTINVYDIPVSSFSVTGSCLSDSIVFNNTSSIGAGTMSFAWSLGDGTTTTNSSVNHKYASAGSYQVKLVATSNGGCKDSTTTTVNIYPTPSASFNTNDNCFAEATIFTNNSSISLGTLSYFWDFDNGSASTLANPSFTFNKSGSYNVKLTATSNQGCSDSSEKMVNVYVNPKADFAFAKTCLDDTTVFTNNSTISSGNLNFIWDFDDGNNSNLSNSKNRYSKTGTYFVELIAVSTYGCADTSISKVHINPKANSSFIVQNTCLGEFVSFRNNSSISSGSFTTNWNFDDGTSSNALNPKHLYNAAGTYLPSLTLTTDSGCISVSNTGLIINEKPTASFSFNNVCANDTAQFIDNASINSGTITNHNWSFGDGFTTTLPSPLHKYDTKGNYGVELIVASDSGCTDTANATISIYAVPLTYFSANNVCFGDTLFPSNTSSISGGIINSYRWNFGDGNTSNSQSPSHYYVNKGNFDIKLIATSNNNCSDSLTKQVIVDNVIIPGFSFSNSCIGNKIDFTNTTNASCGNISSYQWAFGDGGISSQTNPSYVYNKPGTYNVRLIVTEKAGRKDTITQQVTVYPNPNVLFSVNDTCANSAPIFNNQSSIISGNISDYTWSFGDGTKSSNAIPQKSYNNQGTYKIQLLAESNFGCKDSMQKNIEIFELPTVRFNANVECLYDSVYFTNRSSISSNSLSYSWNFDDLGISTSANPIHKYSNAGKFDVKLIATSVKGCSSSLVKSVYVNHVPNASIIGDSTCVGFASAFKNYSNITRGTLVNNTWRFGDGFGSANSNPSHTYSTSGNFNVSLIIESDSGCFDTSATIAVVHPNPQADFVANNVCLGDALNPTNNSSITSGSISKWQWSFGDGNSSTLKSPSHTYSNNGSYSVQLGASSNYGCKDSIAQQVVVSNVITAGFTTNDICLGDTAFFTNTTSTSCGTIIGYQWNFGDGNASTATNPFRIYGSTGTYTVQLIVTQQGGNKDTVTSTITVSPKPRVNFFANNACAGKQLQFQNLSTISSGNIGSYIWNFGNGNKSIDRNPKHTYSSHGAYDVVLIATSNQGCTDSVSKPLSIYELPVVSFIAENVCFGESTTFNNKSSISTGSIDNSWDFGDGFSSSQINPSYQYSNAGSYTVELTVTTNNFCTSKLSQAIKVFELPNVDFEINDTCEADEISLTNNSTIANGALSFAWDFGNGNTSNAKTPSLVYTNDGSYLVELKAISNAGCADSLSKSISIFEKPMASFNYNGTCPDQSMSFSNTSSPASLISSNQWLFNGSDATTSTNSSYIFGSNGPHTVVLTITSINNCIDTAVKQVRFESVPVASFSFNSGCERDSFEFINKTTIQSGNLTYNWTFGDGNSSTQTNPKNVYATTGNFDIKLVATSDLGCADSLIQSVSPLNKPEVDFAWSGACLGDTVYFNNNTSKDFGQEYQWHLGVLDATDTLINSKYYYTSTGKYNVALKVIGANNCSDSITKSIEIAEGPKNLDFTFNDACARTKVKFNNQTTNSNLNFRWVFFDGSFSTEREPEKYYARAGKYPVGFEASEGDCADSTYKLITIFPYADSSFTFKGLGSRAVIFTPQDSNIHSYNWEFGDGNTSTSFEPTHTYSNNGTYTVTLTVITQNGCQSISTRQVEIQGSSIHWIDEKNIDFDVFPNPFTDFVSVSFEIENEGRVTIEVFNEIGQVVSTPLNSTLRIGKYQLPLFENTANLRGGVYYVKMVSNDNATIKRIVLQK